jgi:hypothetical protein
MRERPKGLVPSLFSRKVAYWYFRLNRFFQIENFVVHPARRGGQRMDNHDANALRKDCRLLQGDCSR